MSNKRKLVVVTKGDGTESVFADLFDDVVLVHHGDTVADDFTALDRNTVVMFEGGTDVNPRYYHEPLGQFSDSPDSNRDMHEFALFYRCQRKDAAVIGICRGAQLACVASGGALIQHVHNHQNTRHPIRVLQSGRVMPAASDHHQMMHPYVLREAHWELVAVPSPSNRSNVYLNGDNNPVSMRPDFKEPEIVWFPKSRALAIQPHPEWMPLEAEFPQYCRELVKQYIFGEEK